MAPLHAWESTSMNSPNYSFTPSIGRMGFFPVTMWMKLKSRKPGLIVVCTRRCCFLFPREHRHKPCDFFRLHRRAVNHDGVGRSHQW